MTDTVTNSPETAATVVEAPVEVHEGVVNFTENTVENPDVLKNVTYLNFDKTFDDEVFDLSKLLDRRFW